MKNLVPTLTMPTAEEVPVEVEAEAEAENVMVAAAEADAAIDVSTPKIVLFLREASMA